MKVSDDRTRIGAPEWTKGPLEVFGSYVDSVGGSLVPEGMPPLFKRDRRIVRVQLKSQGSYCLSRL